MVARKNCRGIFLTYHLRRPKESRSIGMRFVLASIVLSLLAVRADALEVWLASSEQCNSCAIYQRAAQARGYGRALRYADGSGLTIPILSIDKSVLASDVLAQLPEAEGP